MHVMLASRLFALVALSIGLAPLSGCTGATAGADLTVRPTSRPLSKYAGKVLRVPQDEKFALTQAPATQAPGLEGKAEGKAECESSGKGKVAAKVEKGGTASGTFQLGHSVKNDGERQIDLTVRVKMNYEYAAEAEPANARGKAAVSLNLFVRDGRNRLLQTYGLVAQSSEEGKLSSKAGKEAEFTLTLGPGDAATVYLAGVADANLRDGESGQAKLQVSDVSFEFESRAAPEVKAADAP
ncbi:MAG: hypothetical protein ACKVS9_06905 [Phycisphaerae bacterium]